MSPSSNISSNIKHSNTHSKTILCKYCRCSDVKKHGFYTRNGFHTKTNNAIPPCVKVQRYRCTNAACKSTFSVLPDNVVPYCRFFWSDIQDIALAINSGQSIYSIAKNTWKLPYGIFRRVASLIHELILWFTQLSQEINAKTNHITTFEKVASICTKALSWISFTWQWQLKIYPLRFEVYLKTHKLAISQE